MEDIIRQYIMYDTGRVRPFALLGIKVLNYNRINAMMGTDQGDALLKQIGSRLAKNLPGVFLNGRWSGSLFVSVINGRSYREILAYAHTLLETLGNTYQLENRTVSMLFTVAVSRYPDDALTAKQLFGNVISLLDRNRNLPGDILFFNEENLKKQQYHFGLIEAMSKLDLDRDLHLGYQPKVNMDDFSCSGAEVLLRWTDANRGPIPPMVFIPLAEQTGFIKKITRWVIRRAMTDICSESANAVLKKAGAVQAINLSVMDLKDRELLPFLRFELDSRQCCAGLIEFEITEGVMIDDDPQIHKNLDGILSLGFRLAIDDFGTGYSSLSYLHKIKMNTLKIDQSFVRELGAAALVDNRPVVDAIISMGLSLGLEIVAEGVENKNQAEYLLEHGCRKAQGWLYSRDLPFREYLEYLETHARPAPEENGTGPCSAE